MWGSETQWMPKHVGLSKCKRGLQLQQKEEDNYRYVLYSLILRRKEFKIKMEA